MQLVQLDRKVLRETLEVRDHQASSLTCLSFGSYCDSNMLTCIKTRFVLACYNSYIILTVVYRLCNLDVNMCIISGAKCQNTRKDSYRQSKVCFGTKQTYNVPNTTDRDKILHTTVCLILYFSF